MRFMMWGMAAFALGACAQAGEGNSASQPISESMAECAAIFEVTAISADDKGKPDRQITAMHEGAYAFRKAAVMRASQEGVANPKAFVAATYNAKRKKWGARWLDSSDAAFILDASENLDWVRYCGKMGKAHGVLPVW